MTNSANYGVTINNGNVQVHCLESGIIFFQMNAFVEREVYDTVKKSLEVMGFLGMTPYETSAGIDAIASLSNVEDATYIHHRKMGSGFHVFIHKGDCLINPLSLTELAEYAKKELLAEGVINTTQAFIQTLDDGTFRITYWLDGDVSRTNSIDAALEMAGLYVEDAEDDEFDDEPEFFDDEDDDMDFDDESDDSAELVAKLCTKCGEMKPLEQFYAQSGGYLGRRADCIECNRAADAERRRRKHLRSA